MHIYALPVKGRGILRRPRHQNQGKFDIIICDFELLNYRLVSYR